MTKVFCDICLKQPKKYPLKNPQVCRDCFLLKIKASFGRRIDFLEFELSTYKIYLKELEKHPDGFIKKYYHQILNSWKVEDNGR